MTFDIRFFGAIEIRHNGTLLTGFRSQKALVLLAYLLCEGRALPREYLAGLGWPESDQSQALGLLRRSLHDLNSQLPGCLDLDRRTVRFQLEAPVAIDVQQFRMLAAQADVESWAAAAALYQAPFLQGIYVDDAPELESWLLREQEQWQGEMIRLLKRLADYQTESGNYAQALDYTQRLLALEPWREEVHRQAMILLARTGQVSAALAQYESCRRALQTELDVEPAHETKMLRARLAAIAQLPTPSLPAATTPFIGRTAQLAELAQLLANRDCRLITLLGPGGMGKTRLALETARGVATAEQRRFLHGVHFVPLVGVATLPQLVAALGHALALPFQPQSTPETQLLHYLHDKELLLLLDNFEQLVNEPVAAFVRQLLDRAPDLKLLITSRVRLHLHGEQLYWMQGLAVPITTTRSANRSVAEVATYSSVQLFLATVQRSQPDYSLSTADAAAVTTICQLVQGMPLATELAAAWISVLTPAEIAAELARDLDFLASDAHDLPLRQRSMRAVFDASWRLLTAAEQKAFSQLAVFRGGFTRSAAQAVAGASLPVLMGLIHKSFLQHAPTDRYQIHELVRQFTEEKLAETSTNYSVAQEQHSRYYLTFLTQRTPGLQGAQQPSLLNEIEQELANIRHGWLWAARQGNFILINGALDGLYDYYQTRSQHQAGIEIFKQAIHLLEQEMTDTNAQQLLNRLQARHGALCWGLSHYEQAHRLLQASLDIARTFTDKKEIAFCLEFLGRTVQQKGSRDAVSFLEESLALSYALSDQRAIATTLHTLAAVFDNLAERPKARQFAEQSLVVSRQLAHPHRIASAFHRLGSIARGLGEYKEAVDHFQAALTVFRQVDDRFHIILTLGELGKAMYLVGAFLHETIMMFLNEAVTRARELGSFEALFVGVGIHAEISLWNGDYALAEGELQELAERSRQMPSHFLATCLAGLGQAELGLGKLTLARSHLLEAMTETLKTQTRLVVNCQLALCSWADLLCKECEWPEIVAQPTLVVQRQAFALEIVASLLAQPQGAPFYKASAAQLIAKVETQLPTTLVVAAQARGQQKTLSQFIAEIIAQEA